MARRLITHVGISQTSLTPSPRPDEEHLYHLSSYGIVKSPIMVFPDSRAFAAWYLDSCFVSLDDQLSPNMMVPNMMASISTPICGLTKPLDRPIRESIVPFSTFTKSGARRQSVTLRAPRFLGPRGWPRADSAEPASLKSSDHRGPPPVSLEGVRYHAPDAG